MLIAHAQLSLASLHEAALFISLHIAMLSVQKRGGIVCSVPGRLIVLVVLKLGQDVVATLSSLLVVIDVGAASEGIRVEG